MFDRFRFTAGIRTLAVVALLCVSSSLPVQAASSMPQSTQEGIADRAAINAESPSVFLSAGASNPAAAAAKSFSAQPSFVALVAEGLPLIALSFFAFGILARLGWLFADGLVTLVQKFAELMIKAITILTDAIVSRRRPGASAKGA